MVDPIRARSISYLLFILILVTMLSLTIFPSGSNSQGTVEFSFGEISHGTRDNDEDGKFEYLVVTVMMNIFVPGTYGMHGDIGYGITANDGPIELGIGEHQFELLFSGGAIGRSFILGTLNVDLEAYSRDVEVRSRTTSYQGQVLIDPENFEPPSDGYGTEVRVLGDNVVLESQKMEVRINKTSPTISFTYPGEVGEDKWATIDYLNIIAFDDLDEDGIWSSDTDTLKYSAELDDVVWELETDFTKGYVISLFGVVQLKLVETSTVAGWARLTFTISSDHMTMEPPSQKFDIDIDLWQNLDADRIAIEHTFRDDTGRFDLEEGLDEITGDQAITVKKSDDRAYGTYSWTEVIETGELDLNTTTTAVSWFNIQGHEASIWFSYPLDGNVQLIHHDPRISMDPDVPKISDEDEFLGNSPIVMILGTVAGLLIVGGTVFLRKYKKKLDDMPIKGGDA